MQYGFFLNTDRCVACETCVVACKSWNNIAPGATAEPGTQGPKWRKVSTVESGSYPTADIVRLSVSCNHCAKPACVDVCPVHAITKREQDGIVVVDSTICIGCRACGAACPFDAPQYGEDGKMQKCDLCLSRLDAGAKPACVGSCIGKALAAGPLEELAKLPAAKSAGMLTGPTAPSLLIRPPM